MDERPAIARPYARALLAAAGPDIDVKAACLNAAAIAAADPRVAAAINRPQPGGRGFAQAFAAAAADCGVVSNLITVLIDNRRLAYLPDIAEMFGRLRDEQAGHCRVQVISAQPLTAADTAALTAALARRLSCTIELTVTLDPALLAGVIVQIGDTTLDGSARGRLQALAAALDPF
ncbi:MAG: F0F1 ATP synthase subunit delta [Acidiferrobacter sp.]